MRRTKMIVLWSFGALLLAASAVVVFLAVAGDEFYRWVMRQTIEGTIDREIRADGTFSFNVGLEALSRKLGWKGRAIDIRLARCANSPSSVTAFHLKLSAIRSGCTPNSL